MKKIFFLTSVVTITLMIFIACNKNVPSKDVVNNVPLIKIKQDRQFKILDFLGIKIKIEFATGCLNEEYYDIQHGGGLKKRSCTYGCEFCFAIAVGPTASPILPGELNTGEIQVDAPNNITMWLIPENISSELNSNLNDGEFNTRKFGIGANYNDLDAIIIPAGNYPVVFEDGKYKITLQF